MTGAGPASRPAVDPAGTSGAPTVVVVAGQPGSGKTTLGVGLAVHMGAVVLDMDTVTNPLIAAIAGLIGAGDDLDHPGLGGPVRAARYRCVIDVAAENAALGRPVVMVAPFTSEISDPAAWAGLQRQFAGPVQLVWVTVPADVAWERRRARGHARDVAAMDKGEVSRPAGPAVPFLAADGAADTAAEVGRLVTLLSRP